MTQKQITEKEQLKAEREAKQEADAAFEKEQNAGRKGKGTRVTVGYTRGRSTQRIVYEAFDESQADTLPTSLAEFMELTKVTDEKSMLSYVIDGYNSAQYTNASDPIAEFVNLAWPDDTKNRFRLAVRNYANATECSVEDAVALIKPGIEAAYQKSLAAA